jgi:hypothetical protein
MFYSFETYNSKPKYFKTIFKPSIKTVINNKDNEMVRIVYVGLTCARKILVVAVPNGC